MLKCREVRNSDEFAALKGDWDRLVLKSTFVDVYATWGFATAWWRTFGDSRTLHLAVVEDEAGVVRLIAPFYADNHAPQVWKLIGNFRADYTNLIHEAGDQDSFRCLTRWLHQQKGWHRIVVENIPDQAILLHGWPCPYEPDSSRLKKLWSYLRLGSPLVYRGWRNYHPRITGTKLAEYGDLLDDKNYRKHVNWFRRQGDLQYRCIADPEEIRSRLPAFMELHRSEWGSKGMPSLFQDPVNGIFYDRLVESLAGYDAVRLDWLTLSGRVVAAHFGFTWAGRLYYYKPCYEPEFASHSPGKILLAYTLRRALEEKCHEVDMLYGLEPYKMQYASDVRRTGSVIISRSPLRALLNRFRQRQAAVPAVQAR